MSSRRQAPDYVRIITQQIDNLSRTILEYLDSQGLIIIDPEPIKQTLYSNTFNLIFDTLHPKQEEPEPSDPKEIQSQLRDYLTEFKRETLQMVVERPFMSLFDFVVSDSFNDLYNIVTICEDKLPPKIEKSPQNLNKSFDICYRHHNLRKKSKSLTTLTQPKPIEPTQNVKFDDIEFALTQQLIYNMQNDSRTAKLVQMARNNQSPASPVRHSSKKRNELPQLFSFDSSFVKDLPLSKHPYTSNFDQDAYHIGPLNGTLANISGIVREEEEFGFTMEKDQPTSRFELEVKQLDLSQRSVHSSTQLKRSQIIEQDQKSKQLEDREKEVASKELLSIIKEKQLLQMKEQIQQQQSELMQQISRLECDKSQFYSYREQELVRLQLNTQNLEQMERQLKQRSMLKQKENTNLNNMGQLKGHLKNLVQKMQK